MLANSLDSRFLLKHVQVDSIYDCGRLEGHNPTNSSASYWGKAMSKVPFVIHYRGYPDVSYPTSKAMSQYLAQEEAVWTPVLSTISSDFARKFNFSHSHGLSGWEVLLGVFSALRRELSDAGAFGRLTSSGHQFMAPPPSTSSEGQVILGLHSSDRKAQAIDALLAFINTSRGINTSGNPSILKQIQRGNALLGAAYVAEVLPFHKVSSQKIAGSVRSADLKVESLDEAIQRFLDEADEINKAHRAELSAFRDGESHTAGRVRRILRKREVRREKKFTKWFASSEELLKNHHRTCVLQIEGAALKISKQLTDNQREFDRLKDLYQAQLRLRAPVELWRKRTQDHNKQAFQALLLFFTISFVVVLASLLIPFLFGGYIAQSFYTTNCVGMHPAACQQSFSVKGPLTLSGLLLMMSLFMWMVRLQYRVYLSERHLALDASEKEAFAETYLAMIEGQKVGQDNQAIVLASLFRPTQDGIIKDDANSLDLSAAAILAKQMGK